MKNPILVPELRDLLNKKKYKIIKSFLDENHEKEIAEYLGLLSPNEIWKILELVEIYRRTTIFSFLDMDVQVAMVSGDQRKNIAELLIQMSHDDRADLFQHLEKEIADKLLLLLPTKERADVIKLSSYKESTAGAIMTTDYAVLNEEDTAEKSLKSIRKVAPSKETIYYMYVTDSQSKLVGFVSLRRLILARPKQKIKDIMKTEMIFAHVDDDQEQAVRQIEEYDLIALPIIDDNNRLSGIITHDDAIDVIRQEEAEDFEKLMAISGGVEEKPYLEIPTYVHFKKRVFWVIILGIMGIFTGFIIQSFQGILDKLIILSFYMPLLNSAGGNTGSQSASVVIRSLALNELYPKDFFKVIRKEFVISAMLCISLGLITYFRVVFFSGDISPEFNINTIATLIASALCIQVIWSTVFGAMIPIIVTKLKLDPAVISSPLLSTCVDMGGITIYFTVAKLVLGF
ncbi:MAG: magnesium transporter [Spirochaetes bacterium]|nr:magnesium transporter [Spirochaetota bacterium]